MAIYLVSGKLGSGKTLASVGRIQDALFEGRRVATNLDLHLEELLPARLRDVVCMRLPDKPTVAHLEQLGSGNASMDESKNGLIVLDELASWMNARTYQDKSRMAVIDWLLHSRKHGWDVMFICQHIEQIDKQIRTSLVEYLVSCRRTDRVKVPFVGGLIRTFTAGIFKGNLPRLHIATVRYGTDVNAIVSDRWVYRGASLYRAYNTRQVFRDDSEQALFSYLPPWHLRGWNTPGLLERLRRRLLVFLVDRSRPSIPLKPRLAWVDRLAQLPPDEAVKAWRQLQGQA